MDGNGRWAAERGFPRVAGHEAGANALLKAIDAIEESDIEYATFYAFSTENSKRNSEEVGNIMGIITYFLYEKILPIIIERDYKVRFIGELSLMPEELLSVVNEINGKALNNKGKTLIFAICYGGDAEIAGAVNRMLKRRARLNDVTDVTAEELSQYLYTANIPSPDAVVRYGGYKRLSNFMPLQTIYSELFFLDKYWPDFDKNDLEEAEKEFSAIKRNFGGTDG